MRFRKAGGDYAQCNDGDITARSVGVESNGNSYISQLEVILKPTTKINFNLIPAYVSGYLLYYHYVIMQVFLNAESDVNNINSMKIGFTTFMTAIASTAILVVALTVCFTTIIAALVMKR